jgi:nucleoside-diphosphate-sugar epimerase
MVYGNFDLYAYEDMVCQPKGTYAILKYAGEQLARDYCQRAGIDCVVLRPSSVYGPRDVTDRVVSKFFTAAMANKELVVNGSDSVADFTYVDDAVDGIIRASMSFNSSNRTYNVTRGNLQHLLTAAEMIVGIVGQGTIKIVDADPNFPLRGSFSNIRAGQDFGYCGKINIEEGFQLYYNWLQSK